MTGPTEQKSPGPTHEAEGQAAQSVPRKGRLLTRYERFSLIFQGLIFTATLIYAGFAGWQLWTMQATLKQITRQSEAAEQTVKASNELVARAQEQAAAAQRSAKAAITQTDVAKESLDLARKGVGMAERSLEETYRPVVGLDDIRPLTAKDREWTLSFSNQGHGPAFSMHLSRLAVGGGPPAGLAEFEEARRTFRKSETSPPGLPQLPSVLGAGSHWEFRLPLGAGVDDIIKWQKFMMVDLALSYADQFNQTHETAICIVAVGDTVKPCTDADSNYIK